MPDFLEKAGDQVKTLAGIKFSNSDLLAYQLCLRAAGGRYDMPFGCDEYLLAALVLGCGGAVGSTYNFAAPIYQRLLAAFQRGDLQAVIFSVLDDFFFAKLAEHVAYRCRFGSNFCSDIVGRHAFFSSIGEMVNGF